MNEQLTRDAEIARIHVEEELKMLIDGLDRRNKIKTSEEVSEEDIKGMMQLVPVEDVYVEALQVKNPIIDWEIHSEGKKDYWKIIRLGGHTAPKKRVKRLERKKKSKTSGLKRLRRVGANQIVESSSDTVLGAEEDASKQGVGE
nr:hypothetical protein [Tanacetum cinerariifolium]